MLHHHDLEEGLRVRYIGYNSPGFRFGFKSNIKILKSGRVRVKDMDGHWRDVYQDQWIKWDDYR